MMNDLVPLKLAHLFERGGYRSLDKGSVDATSAVIILESWFEQQC